MLSSPADREKLGEIILRYSTTIGLRWSEVNRMTLKRRIQRFESSVGPVSMKLSRWGDEIVRVTAEYEDLKRISRETGVLWNSFAPWSSANSVKRKIYKNGSETAFDTS